ncbi:hypothetical protein Tdes44962_MAKER10151 [Teratosphaeria destructans]|uniref:DUF1750-domain-containing protein n=1 Tax=Teratosphaeria destructans TaxID=418781 RepID=A0A9W7W0M1_9PEZI|nr:hypothetical protein Tdes44962_MAKER10151 [Teratosphaeria destructans]
MQHPYHGVARPLQNHVHLLSAHRYPVMQHLSLEQAYRYLLDVTQIVKQLASMSWQYVQAPPDGTIWLEWLAPERMHPGSRFPSDGYVWADNEQTFRQDYNGYTIEICRHNVGFRPGVDQVASHARTRYHFVAKSPQLNAAMPDQSLWIVHYHETHGAPLPTAQVPFTPQMHQVFNERRWLEGLGRLERKDFMLHDRASWPMITVPNSGAGHPAMHPGAPPAMQQPGYYPPAQRSGFPQYYPQGQPGGQGQPPPKRQRPNQSISGPSAEGVHDTTIEDEENTTMGDFFDHLTPRDISMTRYTQHHRWMEEVFSSPYASRQIVPTDLGLGLMGELKGLTEGILEPPNMDLSLDTDKPPKPKEAEPFTALKQEQLEEFNKRVEKHLEEGQAEIERMKADHAAKMVDWKKSNKIMEAEKRLRYATWKGHEAALPAFRLEAPDVVAAQARGGAEDVDDIIKEVQEALSVQVNAHKDVNLVEKGGLVEEEQPPPKVHEAPKPMPPQQSQPQNAQSVSNGEMVGTYHSDPIAKSGSPAAVAQATAAPSQTGTPQPPAQGLTPQVPASDMNDAMMGNMDGMDVDLSNNDFNFEEAAGLDSQEASMTPAGGADVNSSAQNAAANSIGAAPQQPDDLDPSSALGGSGEGDDTGMFDPASVDNTFSDLANLEGLDGGEPGESLIDFGGDDPGMGSAFDDALGDSMGMGDGGDGGQGAGGHDGQGN